MKKLNVLFVTNQLIYGGAERYTVSVANYLHEKGCKVAVISRGGPMEKLLNKKIIHFYAPVREDTFLNRIRTAFTIIYATLKIRAQIVHTQSPEGAVAAKIAKVFTRVPIVKTAHGFPDGRIPSVAKLINSSSDRVVMISDWLSKRLVSFGLEKEKARTILNGIDINKFDKFGDIREKWTKKLKISPADKIIVSVARVDPQKKFEELVYWFPFVLAKAPTAKLIIVGDGGADGEGYRNRLVEQTKSMGLGKSIIFLRGTHQVAEILHIADVFCTPSVGKGFAVLEAMAAGLPVVARRPRGLEDAVRDGVNGFLFSGNDWKGMCERMVFLLENKRIAKELGQQGKMIVRSHFTLDQMMSKLEDLYENLSSEREARRLLQTGILNHPKAERNPQMLWRE